MLGSLFLCAIQAATSNAGVGQNDLPFDSVSVALEGLSSPRAEVRFRAERYLGANLRSGSWTQLVDFVTGLEARDEASMEALWRIGSALGSGTGNLPLALALIHGPVHEEEPGLDLEPLVIGDEPETSSLAASLREIGQHAQDQLLASWRPGLDRMPVSGAALQILLTDERERSAWTPIRLGDGESQAVVGRLNRLGDLPMPLVIAPDLAEFLAEERFLFAKEPPILSFDGPWDTVLLDFAQLHGLAWEAVLWDGEFGDEIAWLRLVKRGDQGQLSGHEQVRLALGDYSRKVWGEAGQKDPGTGAELNSSELDLVAAFLGGIEWPAAMAWLGDLWFDSSQKDAAAFHALADAAGRGQFDARFLVPAGLASLFQHAEQLEALGGPGESGLRDLGHALRKLPRLGPLGPLDGVVLADWPDVETAPDSLYLRFVALESIGGGGEEGRDRALEAMAPRLDSSKPGKLQLAALRVLAVGNEDQGAGTLSGGFLEDPSSLLRLVGPGLAPDELGRLLYQADVDCGQERFLETKARKLRPAALRAIFAAALLGGDAEACAEMLIDVAGTTVEDSWRKCIKRKDKAKFFGQLQECLAAAVRRGDLLDVRLAITAARLRATALGALDSDPAAFPFTGLDRIELLSGAMPVATQNQLLKILAEEMGTSPLFLDTEAIVYLAAGPGGLAARSLLVSRFEASLQSPRVGAADDALAAVEQTLGLLWARNGDEEARVMLLSAAEAAAGVPGHPLSRRVLYQVWPPSFAQISRNLDRLDR